MILYIHLGHYTVCGFMSQRRLSLNLNPQLIHQDQVPPNFDWIEWWSPLQSRLCRFTSTKSSRSALWILDEDVVWYWPWFALYWIRADLLLCINFIKTFSMHSLLTLTPEPGPSVWEWGQRVLGAVELIFLILISSPWFRGHMVLGALSYHEHAVLPTILRLAESLRKISLSFWLDPSIKPK